MSADTNNMSRAVSIINDEEQRGWNLSLTDMDQTIENDNDIVLEVIYKIKRILIVKKLKILDL